MTSSAGQYRDLHEHIRHLDEAGLLYRIDAPVNKDTEMHPLVRWQFRGGIPEASRRAFLFTNVVDSKGGVTTCPCSSAATRHRRRSIARR